MDLEELKGLNGQRHSFVVPAGLQEASAARQVTPGMLTHLSATYYRVATSLLTARSAAISSHQPPCALQ